MIEAPKPITKTVVLPARIRPLGVKSPSKFCVMRLHKSVVRSENYILMDDVSQNSWAEAWHEAVKRDDDGVFSLENDIISILEMNEDGEVINNITAEKLEEMVDLAQSQLNDEINTEKSLSSCDRFI